jgi:hypothetical protein
MHGEPIGQTDIIKFSHSEEQGNTKKLIRSVLKGEKAICF